MPYPTNRFTFFFFYCPLAPTTRLVGKGVTKKRKAFHRSENLAMYLFSPLPPIPLPKPPLDAEENLKLQGRRISVLESPSHRTLFQSDHFCCYIGVCDHLLVKYKKKKWEEERWQDRSIFIWEAEEKSRYCFFCTVHCFLI